MAKEKLSRAVLKSHGLRITGARVAVVDILQKNKAALSQHEIEAKLELKPDRVTLYRLFKDLEDAGIIHKLYDTGGNPKFALCHDCEEHDHNDNHIHFSCSKCMQTFCLDNVAFPKMNLPSGYIIENTNVNLEGVCINCS